MKNTFFKYFYYLKMNKVNTEENITKISMTKEKHEFFLSDIRVSNSWILLRQKMNQQK